MLKNITPAEWKTSVAFELVFDDGKGNGYAFPCDSKGNLLEGKEKNPIAHANYISCLGKGDKFIRFGEIVERKQRYRENGHGTCLCGAEVELQDAYYGACQCHRCGRWYNLFGQEVLSPDQWEQDSLEEIWG